MLGDVIGGRSVTKDWMPLSEMDPNMARAAIAGGGFALCYHSGFDFRAIGAAGDAQCGGRPHPGRIDDQPADREERLLFQGGGYLRKAVEAWFTFLIEHLWAKRRIMEVYLNIAETGIGTYGAKCRERCAISVMDASHLTPLEAARIAAVLPLPKKRAAIDPRGLRPPAWQCAGAICRRGAAARLDRCLS